MPEGVRPLSGEGAAAAESRRTAGDGALGLHTLRGRIKTWAKELGFQQAGISDISLHRYREHLEKWLAQGCHGDMEWMRRHAEMRLRPEELLPGTARVICCRMNYLPAKEPRRAAAPEPHRACISRYARGKDYHKLVRRRLAQLARRIAEAAGPHRHRAFADSAPVLERALASKAGLGWTGKNTMLIHRDAGSWFFLGEIYTDIPLPADEIPVEDSCGTCRACLDACPTGAFQGPYRLDARKCISYLTIEHKGAIPEELRAKIGNRIFGCDDCQQVCPWNRHAPRGEEKAFQSDGGPDGEELSRLFAWSEEEYLSRTEGSPLRRTGYERWLRNIAVALGNAPPESGAAAALWTRSEHPSPLVREHVRWALAEQRRKAGGAQEGRAKGANIHS